MAVNPYDIPEDDPRLQEIYRSFGIGVQGSTTNTPGFTTSLKQGLWSNVQGLGQLGADFVPGVGQDNALKRWGEEGMARNPSSAASASWEGFKESPWQGTKEFLGSAVGSTAPSLAAAVLTGGGSAVAGGAATAAAGRGLVSKGLSWAAANPLQTAIAGVPMYGQNREQQRHEGYTDDTWGDRLGALGAAALQGKIESGLGAQRYLGKAGANARADLVKEFAATPLKTGLRTLGKTGVEEAFEEGLQQPLQQLSAYQNPTTAENLRDTGWSMFGGLIGGLGLGGISGARMGMRHAEIDRFRQADLLHPNTPLSTLDDQARWNQAFIERDSGEPAGQQFYDQRQGEIDDYIESLVPGYKDQQEAAAEKDTRLGQEATQDAWNAWASRTPGLPRAAEIQAAYAEPLPSPVWVALPDGTPRLLRTQGEMYDFEHGQNKFDPTIPAPAANAPKAKPLAQAKPTQILNPELGEVEKAIMDADLTEPRRNAFFKKGNQLRADVSNGPLGVAQWAGWADDELLNAHGVMTKGFAEAKKVSERDNDRLAILESLIRNRGLEVPARYVAPPPAVGKGAAQAKAAATAPSAVTMIDPATYNAGNGTAATPTTAVAPTTTTAVAPTATSSAPIAPTTAVAPTTTTASALPTDVKLPKVQQKVFDHVVGAAQRGDIGTILDAQGVFKVAEIGTALGLKPGSVKMALNGIQPHLAKALGAGSVEQAKADLAASGRRVEAADATMLGVSPKFQNTTAVDDADLFGGGEGSAVTQGMGIISSVGGSQSDIGSDDGATTEVTTTEEPVGQERAAKAMDEANTAILAELRANSHRAEEAMSTWNEYAEDNQGVPFSEIPPRIMATWLLEYNNLIDAYSAGKLNDQELTEELDALYDDYANSADWERVHGNQASIGAGETSQQKAAVSAGAGDIKKLESKAGTQPGSVRETEPAGIAAPEVTPAAELEAPKRRRVVKKSDTAFSEGGERGQPAAKIESTLRKLFFSPARFDALVRVIQSVRDLTPDEYAKLSTADDPKAIRGYVSGGKTVLIADNIKPGDELAVFLHEVGVHMGMKNLIGAENFDKLTALIGTWGGKKDGSIESQLARAALARAAHSSSTNVEEEPLAYFIEEAVSRGIDPTAINKMREGPLKNFFRTLWAAAKAALRKLGLGHVDQLTAQNLVDLAYGAADLELSGNRVGARQDSGSIKFSEATTPRQAAANTNAAVKSIMEDHLHAGKSQIKELSNKALQLVAFTRDLVDIAVHEGLSGARNYYELANRKDAEQIRIESEVDRILTKAYELSKGERTDAQRFIKDSTIAQKWGFKPDWLPEAEEDGEFRKRFYNTLTPNAQKVVKDVFRHADKMHRQLQEQINAEINRDYDKLVQGALDADRPDKAEDLERERKRALSTIGRKLPKMQGPYAPLKRFGNYVFVGKSQRYLDAEKSDDQKEMRRLIDLREGDYVVSFFDTKYAAELYKRNNAKEFASTDTFERQLAYDKIKEVPWGDILKVKNAVEEMHSSLELKNSMQKLLTELYITMLSDASARKSELRREGIQGASDEMFRAFATKGRADAHFYAALKHNGDISRAMNDMYLQTKGEKGEPATDDVRARQMRVFNELMARYKQRMNYAATPFADNAMRLTSWWMLITSPGYYIQNALQVGMLTFPVLAGNPAIGAKRAASVLIDAYKGGLSAAVLKSGNTLNTEELERQKMITPAERRMLDTLVEQGKIDITIAQDLGRAAAGEGMLDSLPGVGKGLRAIQNAAQRLEMLNRVVTALAAYRLTGNTDYAGHVIDNSHGDYKPSNAPRWMQGSSAAKLLTQFRKFQLIQLSLLGRQVATIMNSDNAQEKAAAWATLRWIAATHGVMAGGLGLPVLSQMLWLLAPLFGLGGGDDEPRDVEGKLRKAIGDKDVADLLLRGVPAWFGLDMSGKVGMGNTFSVFPFLDTSGQHGYEKAIVGMGGAAVATGMSMAKGADLISKGDYYKGMELLLPKGVRDGMRAARFASEGITNKRGDVLMKPEELDSFDVGSQAIGLPSTHLQERQRRVGEVIQHNDFYTARTTELRDQYAKAYRAHDKDTMNEIRQDWTRMTAAMRTNGIKPPAMQSLFTAPMQQMKRERQVKEGVAYTDRTRKFVERAVEE